jgi:hypothetical protein
MTWALVALALVLVAAYLGEVKYSILARVRPGEAWPIIAAAAFLLTIAALIVLK